MVNLSKVILFSFLMLNTMIINCNITKIKPAAQKLAALCTQRSICSTTPTASSSLTPRPSSYKNEIERASYDALDARDLDFSDDLWAWAKRFEQENIKSNPRQNEIMQAVIERKFDKAESLIIQGTIELCPDENIDRNIGYSNLHHQRESYKSVTCRK